jgi:hypothetical protein
MVNLKIELCGSTFASPAKARQLFNTYPNDAVAGFGALVLQGDHLASTVQHVHVVQAQPSLADINLRSGL